MNSSGWDRFRKQQAAEREQLRRLLAVMEPLLVRCRDAAPTDIELAALATMLHSFYTGIENIFKRVALELDGAPPHGEAWHRDLLRHMAQPALGRPALLSVELHDTLLEYLRFRHVFRSAYSFDLDWRKMSGLVLAVGETLRAFEQALDELLQHRPTHD